KYATFPPLRPGEGGGAGEAGGARIDLNANFRSRPSVVDALNFLFRQLMTPTAAGMAYDDAARLVAAAEYPPSGAAGEAPVEVHILERRPGSEPWPGSTAAAGDGPGAGEGADAGAGTEAGAGAGEGAGDEDSARSADAGAADALELDTLEREALVVARRIRALVEGEEGAPPLHVWDPDRRADRPARYRDIVVLLRSLKWKATIFAEMLAREGVPVHTRAGGGYFAAMEIELVLALLSVIDNPRQDIALAAVLRSPVVGLSPAELAEVRLCDRRGDFYDAVCAAARAEGPLAERLRRFLADLEGWRTAARRDRLSHLVERLYRETGFLAYAGGLPAGEQRRANLLALLDRARQFDTFARQGLYRFLRFVERLREREADLGPAPALGEQEDAVRVMTIHQSKGLEFPVVIVADLGAPFQRTKGDLFVDRGLGLGFKVVDTALRIKYPSAAYWAVRERADAEGLREELRILYVALTRARERLILVGSTTDLVERAAGWLPADSAPAWELPDALVTGAKGYLDWLGMALLRHPDGRPLRELVQAGAG
ncbi:MAG: helicase, partial [Firmicutes bacterium]|nr:helicase [Bacillota bacterium]